MASLGLSKGWVAVTHDQPIRYKPNELAAVTAHKAALLVVVGRGAVRRARKGIRDDVTKNFGIRCDA